MNTVCSLIGFASIPSKYRSEEVIAVASMNYDPIVSRVAEVFGSGKTIRKRDVEYVHCLFLCKADLKTSDHAGVRHTFFVLLLAICDAQMYLAICDIAQTRKFIVRFPGLLQVHFLMLFNYLPHFLHNLECLICIYTKQIWSVSILTNSFNLRVSLSDRVGKRHCSPNLGDQK